MVALVSFIENLTHDSALAKSIDPKDEFSQWFTTAKTNAILADIYDAFAAVHAKRGRIPKPYPRPQSSHGTRTIGKGAIPISEFWDWWNNGG